MFPLTRALEILLKEFAEKSPAYYGFCHKTVTEVSMFYGKGIDYRGFIYNNLI